MFAEDSGRSPTLRHPVVTLDPMIIGVLIGLAAGVLIGLGWHFARGARAAGEARLAEARLADAKLTMTEQSVQLQALSARARGGGTVPCGRTGRARSDAQARSGGCGASRGRPGATGRHVRLAVGGRRWPRTTSSSSPWPTPASAKPRTAAQGDLAQRQQAIEEMLTPLSETLARYERGIQQMEVERQGAYAGLSERVAALHLGHEQLQKETRNLVTALRSPHTRGRWGEMTLRRAVEAAGMLEHCDFEEQKTVVGDDGYVRPDMIVLPAGRRARWSSTPRSRSTRSSNSSRPTTTTPAGCCSRSTRKQLRTHVDQLAKKEYWKQFDRSPEFVVAFIPGDPLLAAALDADPTLQEHALDKRVILATPNTLVADVAHRRARHGSRRRWPRTPARYGTSVRSSTSGCASGRGTWRSLQKSLSSSVDAYNRAVGSLESRVLVTARKFPALGVVGGERAEITELTPIESRAPPSASGRGRRRRRARVRGRGCAAEHLAVARQHGRRPAARAPSGLTSAPARAGGRHAWAVAGRITGVSCRSRANSGDVLCQGAARPPL